MDRFIATNRRLVPLLAALFLWATLFIPAAQASMVGTQTLAAQQSADAARERVQALLQREDVRDQLVSYGVDPAEAQQRVAALSDAEARQMAQRMDEMPAGGTSILGAAVFIFVVLLITDIL
ncbi:PA2779 family protein, partial [Arhodomonas sp. KWT]